jgi:type II secretory pathway component PulC
MIVFLMFAGMNSYAVNDLPMTKNTYDKYKVIYERNVFSKDRLPPRQKKPKDNNNVRTTKVLSIYVLRGIAAEEARSHKYAFIEEQISSESIMAKIGTKIIGGQIKEIQMDYVLFEEGGKTRKVKVGQEFGTTSTTVMTVATEPADKDTAADNVTPVEEKTDQSSPEGENDLLKKLMERRKRELGT